MVLYENKEEHLMATVLLNLLNFKVISGHVSKRETSEII